jgi:hypothetical protein
MDFSFGTSWGSAIEFDIKELTENKVICVGEALNKDYRSFISVASRGYDIKSTILSEKEIDPDKFSDDILIRDVKKVKFEVEIGVK